MDRPRELCILFAPRGAGGADAPPLFGLHLVERTVLAFLRADDFVDEPNPAIEGDAFITVRLGLEAAEGDPLEIGLRAVDDPEGDDFLVRAGDSATLFKVSRGRLSAEEYPPWIDRSRSEGFALSPPFAAP